MAKQGAANGLPPSSLWCRLPGIEETPLDIPMDWMPHAKPLFQMPKPAHFTNYRHCCECAEHDEALLACDVDSISLQQLGNPGWDPLCFATAEGLLYYLPAFIRLTLDTMDTPQERYLDQLLFHLMYDGKANRIVRACSREQRAFIAGFLEYLMDQYGTAMDECTLLSDDIVKAYEMWSV